MMDDGTEGTGPYTPPGSLPPGKWADPAQEPSVPPAPAPRFAFKIIHINWAGKFELVEEVLNNLGMAGWQIVWSHMDITKRDHAVIVMQREVPADEARETREPHGYTAQRRSAMSGIDSFRHTDPNSPSDGGGL